MAVVSADKLREMEAEMDRFEQEIALPGMSPQMIDFHRPIIGAGTYNQQIADQFTKHFGQSQADYNMASLHFIPHSLQRNPTSIDNNVSTTTYQSSPTTSGPPVIPGTGPYIETQPVLVTSHVIQSPPSPEAKPGPVVITGAPAIYAAPPVRAKPKVEDVYVRKDIRLDSSYQRFAVNDMDFAPKRPDVPSSSMSIGVTAPKHVVPAVVPSYLTEDHSGKKKEKKKKIVRLAGGSAWEDPSLLEWEQDDFRIFCGDLGNDVTDEVLTRAFGRYPSFMKAKVIRDKRNNKTKGYGFVSFKDPQDFIRAMKEMNGKYVGSRPIKLRKSTWRDRNVEVVKKKMKEKQRLGLR